MQTKIGERVGPKSEARVAMVTGASSGFGAAIGRALAQLGWPVALGARRVDKVAEVQRSIEAAGGRAFAHVLDVTDSTSIDAFVEASENELGPVDVVVSNAGIGVPGLLHELPTGALRTELDTNLLGPLQLIGRLLPGMLARQHGDIAFVTSLNATQPRPFQVGYTASKAGLEGAARALQMELDGTGVRATIIRPGPARTEMGSDWDPAVLERLLRSWKSWGILRHDHYLPPESIAAAVVAAVTAPVGTHLDLIQVNPAAPVKADPAS